MKRSVILTDRLGPDILSAFWTKGQVLYRERAHLKVIIIIILYYLYSALSKIAQMRFTYIS